MYRAFLKEGEGEQARMPHAPATALIMCWLCQHVMQYTRANTNTHTHTTQVKHHITRANSWYSAICFHVSTVPGFSHVLADCATCARYTGASGVVSLVVATLHAIRLGSLPHALGQDPVVVANVALQRIAARTIIDHLAMFW